MGRWMYNWVKNHIIGKPYKEGGIIDLELPTEKPPRPDSPAEKAFGPKDRAVTSPITDYEFVGVSHILTFGKYKDKKLRDVITSDPKYVLWLIGNVEGFFLDVDSLVLLKRCMKNNTVDDSCWLQEDYH